MGEIKDFRVLCVRCADDYRFAGYHLILVSKLLNKCDKCGRNGWTFQLKRSVSGNGNG